MVVKIRLQNHGCRNHPFWWIVVQPHKFGPKGRILQKIGQWWPRTTCRYRRSIVLNRHRIKYWLGVGAVPTKGAHKILAKAEMIPKMTVPFGSSSLYEKPDKLHREAFRTFHSHTPTLDKIDPKRTRILAQSELQQLEYHIRLMMESTRETQQTDVARGGLEYVDDLLQVEKYMPSLEGVHTSDIDSDEGDFLTRKRNFQELRRRMEERRSESELMNFKDYRYNMYARKMKKIVQLGSGIDGAGYFEMLKVARAIVEEERLKVEAMSKPPGDRIYSYNEESFGEVHADQDREYTKLDLIMQDMREFEYLQNMQNLKEQKHQIKKLRNPEYRGKFVKQIIEEPHPLEELFGMYPPGYEYLENFEKYIQKYPDRDIQHYQSHMNRECTFYEFVEMAVARKLQDQSLKNMREMLSLPRMQRYDPLFNPWKPEQQTRIVNLIFDDPDAREELLRQFNQYIQQAKSNLETFKLVDCLEMFTHLDPKITTMDRTYRIDDKVFIPTRKGLPPPPNLNNTESEPFDESRLGPTALEFPFKAYTAPNRYMARGPRINKMGVRFEKNGRYYTKYSKYRGATRYHPKDP